MDIYRVRINSIEDRGGPVKVYYTDKPEGFYWEEGAHVHLALPGFDAGERPDKTLVRHMSILTLPKEGRVGIITRLDSSDSRYKKTLSTLKPGDDVYLFKSRSVLRLRRDGRPVHILTMGVAVGAMRPLALSYADDPQGIPSMTGIIVDRREHYPFEEELSTLSAPSLHLVHARSRADFQDNLSRLSTQGKPWFLVIGSDAFIHDCIIALRERGVSLDDIIVDLKDEKRLELFHQLGLLAQV